MEATTDGMEVDTPHIRPSLQRLKSLDALPDLQAQIAEIKALCTHPARAEMIVRWILNRLQSNVPPPDRPAIWNALLWSVRLLSPEKLASLLGPSSLLKTLEVTLKGAEQYIGELLMVLTDLLELLTEQATAALGAPLRAILSLPAPEAATFTGSWLEGCRLLEKSSVQETTLEDRYILPALTIWDMRKRSTNENESFSEHCLLPIATRLGRSDIGPSVTAESASITKKRKRLEGRYGSQQDLAGISRSLLARHIFMPARNAFFRAQDTTTGNLKRAVGVQRPSFMLDTLLTPLELDPNASAADSVALAGSLDHMLSIALCIGATTSPKQRQLEKPWVEASWEALDRCNRTCQGGVLEQTTRRKMLAVMTKTVSLSHSTLKHILRDNAALGNEVQADVEWYLVASVAEMDAEVFLDADMADVLFSSISRASIKLGEDTVFSASAEAHDTTAREHLQSQHALWRDDIVVPVMGVFAKNRRLLDFVSLWKKQLQQDLHGTFRSVWTDLDSALHAVLQDSLTGQQLLDLSHELCRTINAVASDPQTEQLPELGAIIVILNAILGGLRDESILRELHSILEDTFQASMLLRTANIGPGLVPALQERRSWTLMTRIFELWFPAWAASVTDAAAVVNKVKTLVPQEVLDQALSASSTVHPNEYGSVKDPASAIEAKCFAGSVCSVLLKYRASLDDETLLQLTDVVNKLGSSGSLYLRALARYPGLLTHMDRATRRSALTSHLQGLIRAQDIRADMRAIVDGAVAYAQHDVIEDLVHACTVQLGSLGSDAENNDLARFETVLELLMQISADALDRSQREKVLDSLCTLRLKHQSLQATLTQMYLPLLVRLMALPSMTAQISTNPLVISQLLQSLDAGTITLEESSDWQDSVGLAEEAAELLIKQLLATQDQERSQKMLIDLSSEVVAQINSLKGGDLLSGRSVELALLRPMYRLLDSGAQSGWREQILHGKPENVIGLMRALSRNVRTGLRHLSDHNASHKSLHALAIYLETLLSIPVALVDACGFEMADLLTSLAEILENRLTKDPLEHQESFISGVARNSAIIKAVLVRCHHVVGKFAPRLVDTHLAEFADKLLRLNLQPIESAKIMRIFEALIQHPFFQRAKFIEQTLDDLPKFLPSTLLLLQCSIPKLDRFDFEDGIDIPPSTALHRLLKHAASWVDLTTRRRSILCITKILREKPFMVNQFGVETTLQTLLDLAQRRSDPAIVYLDICNVLSALLLHHRSRLQGRFHSVIKLFQALLTRLFKPTRPTSTKANEQTQLSAKHAHALSRLLTLFCEPPRKRRPAKKEQSMSLVDEARKEQAHVGRFVQYILHHYCTQILHGTLGEGMSDALMPGLWAMIEAMEINGAEGVKVLSAAMNNSERAVLRGVYDEWRRFGKWRGG